MEKDTRSKTHSLIHIESSVKDALDISDLLTNKFDFLVSTGVYICIKPIYKSLSVAFS